MTDSMKCPFCGGELKECFVGMTYLTCTNIKCDYASLPLFPKVWQALLDGKKARDALKEIKQTLDECFSSDKSGFTVFWDVIARRVHSVITHSTKQEE